MMSGKLIVQSIVALASGLVGGGLLAVTTIVAGDTLLLSRSSASEGCSVVIQGKESTSAPTLPSTRLIA